MRNHQQDTAEKGQSFLLQQALREQAEMPDARGLRLPQRGPVEQVTCRIGDSSCANAHASTLNRTTASRPFRAALSLLQLQRQYGNRYVQRVVAMTTQPGGKGRASR